MRDKLALHLTEVAWIVRLDAHGGRELGTHTFTTTTRKLNLDVVAGQVTWEMEETRIDVEGFKWLEKTCNNQRSLKW